MDKILASKRNRILVMLSVAALGASSLMTQLALMREMLTVYTGNEMALGVMLGTWLLLTGVGTWWGRRAHLVQRPLEFLARSMILIGIIPLIEVVGLRALRNMVFLRGEMVGMGGTVWTSFVVLAPFCVLSGYLLVLTCAILSGEPIPVFTEQVKKASKKPPTGDASTGGRVYIADSLGSIAGGALFSFILVAWLGLDHFSALCVPAALCLVLAVVLANAAGAQFLRLMALVLLISLLFTKNIDALTTQWQFNPFRVVFRGNSSYGKLVVTESPGQFNFIGNGVPLFSTHDIERVEETVHFAMAQRPEARRVLLIGGGVTGTAREVLKYKNVSEVTYVELDPMILEAAQEFMPSALADARIRVVNGDGRLFLREIKERYDVVKERYDVVIVDVPEPSTAQINRLYTVEFFEAVKQSLVSGGVVSFSLCPYANFINPNIARMLATMQQTLSGTFRNIQWIPVGRVLAVASDGEVTTELAGRLAAAGVRTEWVTRNYLEAMLTPDRLAQLRVAASPVKPAALNEDFSPVLYNQHLQNWLSQNSRRSGMVVAVLLTTLIAYPFMVRGATLVVFAGGFAASALEVTLLLAFQILWGSVYHLLGIVVTAFMAGLAFGVWAANRPSPLSPPRRLMVLAVAIGVFAALLPFALLQLQGMTAGVARVVVTMLAGGVAVLVGMEFPVASRAELGLVSRTASRMYTADFVGACLGAVLTSTLLIPLVGVWVTCWLTAGLNFLCLIRLKPRKRRS